jgi:amino acid transporter
MSIRQLILGSPLPTTEHAHQRLSKVQALAVFSSDALSSVAYATEEILLVLITAGMAALELSLPIALVITGLLVIVAASYYQTIHGYPSGGGAYIVAHENLGVWPGLIAAAALLIDYVLTVAAHHYTHL